ncbi:glycogen synthase GlgA [Nibricoccus aquaticus]|uniref:Glycogen synthase n=1 Tax=Nibricoccus aquaticus TaxID=2576891 RepID=A0A290QDV8_9BACT|nr:glycogen synthase GlgA [Nibricoccus aquaticus]ATC65400.1 glycogen synthase GlgA [Nibricoccus aquaticus]
MKIVHVASELFPYVKTGGLADAVGSLCATLAGHGHDVSVFIPGYRAVVDHRDAANAEKVMPLKIEMGDTFMSGDVRMFSPRTNLKIYLICREEFFDRKSPYGNGERDYEDNHHRYIFFCKAVAETLRLTNMRADIVHAHDWQAALMPLFLRYAERRHGVTLTLKTIFTIHNIAFQGVFPMRSFYRTNLPEELMGIDGVEFYGQMSFMKAGILFSDRVTTVSPRYSREIQTPEFGCGLDGVVGTRAEDIVGLINGIDTAVWNPVSDEHLPARYSAGNLAGKAVCRAELLKKMKLEPAAANVPVFGMVCRLAEQKGVQLVLANREFFLKRDCRLVILGAGDRKLEQAVRELAAGAPGKIALAQKLDEALSHLVEAGSDFFVMPSLFEPCGLNQMYSQAYGTVPLVSSVGGLVDTVTDFNASPDEGTGISFDPTAEGLGWGLKRAAALFQDKVTYSAVQARGMARDFSWQKAALAYEQLYESAL